MKHVREYLNEKFIEDSDPIQDMGIGEFAQLKKVHPGIKDGMTPNDLIILGVTHRAHDVINYAIKAGANQLWWEIGGYYGGYHGLTINLITSLERIVKVSGDKIFYKTVAKFGYQKNKFYEVRESITYSSKIFREKYAPVDSELISKLDLVIAKAKAAKSMIDLLNKE